MISLLAIALLHVGAAPPCPPANNEGRPALAAIAEHQRLLCLEKAGDVDGARSALAVILPSPLGRSPQVLQEAAAVLRKSTAPLPDAFVAAASVEVDAFDDDGRNALGDALLLVVERTPATHPAHQRALDRLVFELRDTPAGKAGRALPEARARKLDDASVLALTEAMDRRHDSADVVALLEGRFTDKERSPAACQAQLYLGKAYRKLRRYGASRRAFARIDDACGEELQKKSAYLAARVAALTYAQNAPQVLDAFMKRWPADSYTDDVLMWRAQVAHVAGDVLAEKTALDRLVVDFKNGDQAHEARFRLALLRAQTGAVDDAIALLAENVTTSGTLTDIDRDRYWHGRLLAFPTLGDMRAHSDPTRVARGVEELRTLWKTRSTSYYGVLARARLVQGGVVVDKPDVAPRNTNVEAFAPSAALSADPLFSFARIAVQEHYNEEARLLLNLLPAPTAADDAFAVAALYARIGAMDGAHQTLRGAGLALLPNKPTATTAPQWSLAWPRAFESAITNAAAEAKIPATLVMGLAREESTFDAGVVSWAGAVGLCQLMPPTAKEEASKLGLSEPSIDALKDPLLNARLGAQHLAARMKDLRHPLLAIAAYNAGTGAVRKWKTQKGAPLDWFIEEIPVDETRNYVKKVTGSWATYEALDGVLDSVTFAATVP